MREFMTNGVADISGSFLQGSFRCSYKKLVDILRLPNSESDEYEVSTEWVLCDKEKNVVALYDWKETDLYSDDLPSVEEFRRRRSYDWHIGARDKKTADAFIEWLKDKVK